MTRDTSTEIKTTGTPHNWLLRIVNPMLKVLLRSPLHFLVSDELLLLTVTGRRTGTEYNFPVLYEFDEGVIRVGSRGTNWWKNLRDGGQDVRLYLQGEELSGHADVTENDRSVAEYVHEYLHRHGVDAASRLGLQLPDDDIPSPDRLEAVVDHIVIVTIDLYDHETVPND